MKTYAFAAKYKRKKGILPTNKELLDRIPLEKRKKLENLLAVLPKEAALYVFSYGYPKCPMCGKKVKKISSNRGTQPARIFNLTCSRRCSSDYRHKNSPHWRMLRKEKDIKTKEAVKALSGHPLLKFLSLGKKGEILVSCKKCGAKKSLQLYQVLGGKASCLCVRGAKIAEKQRLTEVEYIHKANLVKRKIRLLEPYQNMHTKVVANCLVCGKEWKVSPNNLRRGSGCPGLCSRKKRERNSLRKYGCKNPQQSKEVKDRFKRTMRARYGVDYALQNKEILAKNLKAGFHLKDYRLGNRIVKVQGYEPQALDYIQTVKKVKAKHIKCGFDPAVPTIKYVHKGKEHIYHPDIFIPHLNRIVEVKSTYTYKVGKVSLKDKRKACKSLGYTFTVLVMNGKGERLNVN